MVTASGYLGLPVIKRLRTISPPNICVGLASTKQESSHAPLSKRYRILHLPFRSLGTEKSFLPYNHCRANALRLALVSAAKSVWFRFWVVPSAEKTIKILWAFMSVPEFRRRISIFLRSTRSMPRPDRRSSRGSLGRVQWSAASHHSTFWDTA